jgi:hypothetical protein
MSSKVRLGKYLCDLFPVHSERKCSNALYHRFVFLFSMLTGKSETEHKSLVHVYDLLRASINIVRSRHFLQDGKDSNLEGNEHKTKYI